MSSSSSYLNTKGITAWKLFYFIFFADFLRPTLCQGRLICNLHICFCLSVSGNGTLAHTNKFWTGSFNIGKLVTASDTIMWLNHWSSTLININQHCAPTTSITKYRVVWCILRSYVSGIYWITIYNNEISIPFCLSLIFTIYHLSNIPFERCMSDAKSCNSSMNNRE